MGDMGTADGRDAITVPQLPISDQAYQLHCRGYSLRQIGRLLQIDKDTAQRMIKAIKGELAGEHKRNVKRWTDDAVERLREVQRAAWATYSAHEDISALNTVIAAEEKIAKLRGLAKPDVMEHKHEVSGTGGKPIEFSFADLVAEVTSGSGGDRTG